MRRLAFTIRADALETVLDRLLPLIPQGVHWTPTGDDALELAVYDTAGDLPSLEGLEAVVGPERLAASEEQAPDDPDERRLRYMRRAPVAGRVVVRPSDAPAPEAEHLLDVVIDSPHGAFGSGSHPTTTMCLELLAGLPPGGAFADLGCGAGVLAITAALLGWEPVFAIDHEQSGVEATIRNAERNGVTVEALTADLLEIAPPPAATIAANVPLAVHAHVAAGLPRQVRTVIASGIVDEHLPEVVAGYEQAGLALVEQRGGPGWVAGLLVRGG
jgi:ribosomal protein L11 methyltransferase